MSATPAAQTLALFPGQGSQRIGMGQHLWETFPEARETFAEAEDLLGWDVRGLCMHGPLEDLTRTDRAQPAIFVTGVAAWRVLSRRGVEPGALMGHSLGEYTALVAAGHLSYADGLRVVAARGAAMYRCGRSQAGTMAAVIGLDDDAVDAMCAALEGVWPANYNSAGQVVVSGTPAGVRRAMERATELGARKVLPLQVSGAFHSPLVADASVELEEVLRSVTVQGAVRGRFFSTTEVRYPAADELRDVLVRQLTSPVRFSQSLAVVLEDHDAAVEVGPEGVLAGLVKRFARRFPVYLTDEAAELEQAAAVLGTEGGDEAE